MDHRVFARFDAICSRQNTGGDVLEVGAVPSAAALLNMESLARAQRKIGINLAGPAEYRDFQIVQGNANAMTMFADDTFDCVLCNAMLEHDKFFWKSVSEIKRVVKPGGLVVLGTPGYGELGLKSLFRPGRAARRGGRSRILVRDYEALGDGWRAAWSRVLFRLWVLASATPTLGIHSHPGDYYRFSPQAFEQVLLDGFEDVQVQSMLLPPTIIGWGIKPCWPSGAVSL
jgi:SAM-dependent methyltransferase